MKIPKKIKICGMQFIIIEKDLTHEQLAGACLSSKQEIHLEETLPQESKEATLLHEIIEAVNCFYELKLKHPQISVLETALYQVLKDNKMSFK